MAKALSGFDIDSEDDFSDFFQKRGRQEYVSTDPINVDGVATVGKAKVKPKKTSKIVPPKNISRTPGLGAIERATAPVATAKNASRTPGLGDIEEVPLVSATDRQTGAIKDQTQTNQDIADKKSKTQLYLAAAKFGIDALNAQSAYNAVDSAAQLNILESRRLANDALERGRQRSLEAAVEGQQVGGDALLALAAQGQDVQGADAQKVQGSLEDIGLYNGLQEEINGVREALGYDLEEVMTNYQVDQARIDRNSTILSSGLNYGATAYASSL